MKQPVFSSYRDPDGHLFYKDGCLYRQINPSYAENYRLLESSGLLAELHRRELLIPHTEVHDAALLSSGAEKILRPQIVPIITYPYEWCFDQLKDAALLTLRIQMLALEHGMSLKDASAYNVQFFSGKPIFIDTLSFEKYAPGKPWAAYRQFCQHFFAPLALMGYLDKNLNQLLKHFIDGIPLDVASRMLPFKSRFNLAAFLHIHAHAGVQKKDRGPALEPAISLHSLRGILDHLQRGIEGLKLRQTRKIWSDYYSSTHQYSEKSLESKKVLVSQFIQTAKPRELMDLGANTGLFSRLASQEGIRTLSLDFDPDCIQASYQNVKHSSETHLMPLVFDLVSPSPGIGWGNQERLPLEERFHPDCVMALALLHHLALTNNLPLGHIARYFQKLTSDWLIVEFVPKSDSQAQRLLKDRKDIFPDYTEERFKEAFGKFFKVVQREPVGDSGRALYLMRRSA